MDDDAGSCFSARRSTGSLDDWHADERDQLSSAWNTGSVQLHTTLRDDICIAHGWEIRAAMEERRTNQAAGLCPMGLMGSTVYTKAWHGMYA